MEDSAGLQDGSLEDEDSNANSRIGLAGGKSEGDSASGGALGDVGSSSSDAVVRDKDEDKINSDKVVKHPSKRHSSNSPNPDDANRKQYSHESRGNDDGVKKAPPSSSSSSPTKDSSQSSRGGTSTAGKLQQATVKEESENGATTKSPNRMDAQDHSSPQGPLSAEPKKKSFEILKSGHKSMEGDGIRRNYSSEGAIAREDGKLPANKSKSDGRQHYHSSTSQSKSDDEEGLDDADMSGVENSKGEDETANSKASYNAENEDQKNDRSETPPEERARIAAKREYSRINTAKSREKRKRLIAEMQRNVTAASQEHSDLKRMNEELRSQVDVLFKQHKNRMVAETVASKTPVTSAGQPAAAATTSAEHPQAPFRQPQKQATTPATQTATTQFPQDWLQLLAQQTVAFPGGGAPDMIQAALQQSRFKQAPINPMVVTSASQPPQIATQPQQQQQQQNPIQVQGLLDQWRYPLANALFHQSQQQQQQQQQLQQQQQQASVNANALTANGSGNYALLSLSGFQLGSPQQQQSPRAAQAPQNRPPQHPFSDQQQLPSRHAQPSFQQGQQSQQQQHHTAISSSLQSPLDQQQHQHQHPQLPPTTHQGSMNKDLAAVRQEGNNALSLLQEQQQHQELLRAQLQHILSGFFVTSSIQQQQQQPQTMHPNLPQVLSQVPTLSPPPLLPTQRQEQQQQQQQAPQQQQQQQIPQIDPNTLELLRKLVEASSGANNKDGKR